MVFKLDIPLFFIDRAVGILIINLLYCISKWLEQEKINPDFILHYLDEEEQSLLKSFYNKENDIEMYLMNYNKVKFPLFLKNETKNENFMISNEPIYYKGNITQNWYKNTIL